MRVRITRGFATIAIAAAAGACARPASSGGAASPAASAPPLVAGELPLKYAPRPTTPAITPADLMTRLYQYADDSMQGRQGGTIGNFKATAYIAAEAQRLGLEPAGENGTWFQEIPLNRTRYDERSSVAVAGRRLTAWTDFLPRDQGPSVRSLDGAQVVFGGVWGDTARMLKPAQAAGKVVLLLAPPAPDGKPGWQANRGAASQVYRTAAGIAVASLDAMPAADRAILAAPNLFYGQQDTTALPAYFYVTSGVARAMLGADPATASVGAAGTTLAGRTAFSVIGPEAAARNVVAILRGSDPSLRAQYVAIGAHNDHVGIQPEVVDHDSLRAFNTVMRPGGAEDNPGAPTAAQSAQIRSLLDSLRRIHPARRDSIANGADDDGSGTVTVLEIAEWFARTGQRPKRSILFVWHTGEELGLLGSAWFTDHPTVPRDSIVAQLNIDMVGRGGAADITGGGPAYLQLIGSRRLSTELGDLVESVNTSGRYGFTFDYQFDTNGNPHQFYCRSDHYEYARYGIPITFFTTGGHRDYHQVTDEPQYIDYGHMARVASLVGDIGLHVANLGHRIVVDKPKPDPKGQCRQ